MSFSNKVNTKNQIINQIQMFQFCKISMKMDLDFKRLEGNQVDLEQNIQDPMKTIVQITALTHFTEMTVK